MATERPQQLRWAAGALCASLVLTILASNFFVLAGKASPFTAFQVSTLDIPAFVQLSPGAPSSRVASPLPAATPPPGAVRYSQMVDTVGAEGADQWLAQKEGSLQQAGWKPSEIDAYFGRGNPEPAKLAPGEQRYDEILAAGGQDAADAWARGLASTMRTVGWKPAEIDAYFGDHVPDGTAADSSGTRAVLSISLKLIAALTLIGSFALLWLASYVDRRQGLVS